MGRGGSLDRFAVAKVIVVGAGVGGLACAIELAARGDTVEVFERHGQAGGKIRTQEVDGARINAGPTVLTLPWVFEELFASAGEDFRAAVPIERAEVVARHAWSDGTTLDLYDDAARSEEAIGSLFGAADAKAFREFQRDTKRMFDISDTYFLRDQRMTVGGIVRRFGGAGLATLASLESHRTMWQALVRRFRSPRLRQLFGRYATYVGSSPFEAPGTLNLITYAESQGVFRAEGGLRGVVTAMEALATKLGVRVHYGAHVESIVVKGGRARGVRTAEGEHAADAVTFNGDVSALGSGLLGPASKRAARSTPKNLRSLSAFTITLRGEARGPKLLHHNVFFGDDYPGEFRALMGEERVPDDPTVYVCAQDRADGPGEGGLERFLVVVNAPPTGDRPQRWGRAAKDAARSATETALARAGLSFRETARLETTPLEFEALSPGAGGSLYGPRSKGPRAVLARAAATTKIRGLYLAGGSVHPGAGVPMAAQSGRLAATKILADR